MSTLLLSKVRPPQPSVFYFVIDVSYSAVQSGVSYMYAFLSMRLLPSFPRKHYEGFEPRHVTPYMHILVYHVTEMVERLGSIKPFSGQGTIGRVMFAHDGLFIFI